MINTKKYIFIYIFKKKSDIETFPSINQIRHSQFSFSFSALPNNPFLGHQNPPFFCFRFASPLRTVSTPFPILHHHYSFEIRYKEKPKQYFFFPFFQFEPSRIESHFVLQKKEEKEMADDKGVGEGEKKDTGTTTTEIATTKKKKGIISRIWNVIFRIHGDDFEKRLQYISKEEAAVLARMKRRSQSWRRMIRHLIIFSVIFEVIAVGYAIVTTRSTDLNWKMRAFRVLPMFLLPAVSFLAYSTFISFTKMCDRKDQKTLERLRAERQAKIDELKEKTNYYTTQQLIQRYDPDPAAKAAAATVLASKLGADSGLKVFVGDESNLHVPTGRSNAVEVVQSGGLRNRKQPHTGHASAGSGPIHHSEEGSPNSACSEDTHTSEHKQLVVNHYNPQGTSTNDGGWLARIAALLVGEDPTQSYALICGNCHMHNGLARKEDFPYITYYCPHCQALNRPKQSDERVSGSTTPNSGSVRGGESTNVLKPASGSASESVVTSNISTRAVPEKNEEETEVAADLAGQEAD